jgi:hypothetical protein
MALETDTVVYLMLSMRGKEGSLFNGTVLKIKIEEYVA